MNPGNQRYNATVVKHTDIRQTTAIKQLSVLSAQAYTTQRHQTFHPHASTAEGHILSGEDIIHILDDVKTKDLDMFLKIISLIKKHYANCTNTYDRVKATILIVKEIEAGY